MRGVRSVAEELDEVERFAKAMTIGIVIFCVLLAIAALILF